MIGIGEGGGWESTWLGQLVGWVAANIPLLIGVGIVCALVYGFGWSFVYIAKGGGQYGIIEGYVGTIGAGKTTLAVQHALKLAIARQAVLLSNIPVVCCKTCGDHCTIEHAQLPMTDDGIDLAELTRRAFALRDAGRGLVLLMDEVGVVMPARLWKDFSVALMWVLQQSRKLAVEWIWTAQDPSFVDSQLRSLTAVVHYVRAFPPPSIWRRVKGKRPWFMLVASYLPGHAPRANSEGSARANERRLGLRLVMYRRRWEAAFDTDGVVLPSRHLKGAEVLVSAVEASGDRHVVVSGASTFGPSAEAPSPLDDGGELEAV